MGRIENSLKYFETRDVSWRRRAEEGIEQNRKGNVILKLVDGNGCKLQKSVLCNAEVEYVQTNHDFHHGANLFMLDEFDTKEENLKYREIFPQICNLATVPFYWKDLEPQKGKPIYEISSPKIYRRPSPDLCLSFCDEQKIDVKAHCLNYDYFRPTWLYFAEVNEHKAQLEKHFMELSERYSKLIPTWEVTNETFNQPFVRDILDTVPYSKFYSEDDFVEWSYDMAEKYFPQNTFMINDHLDFGCMRSPIGEFFGTRSPYYMLIERLIEKGKHLDIIGFQYHCFYDLKDEPQIAVSRMNPYHIYDVLDTYAKLGRKIQITEMTLSALSEKSEDEEFQAELLKNLMTIFFSHPAMEGVVYWNLVDGYASGDKRDMSKGENKFYGGLLRTDLSLKPAGKVYYDLFRKIWHTEGVAAFGKCDTSSSAETQNCDDFTFRGFFGDYKLKIKLGGKEIERNITVKQPENKSKDTHIISVCVDD